MSDTTWVCGAFQLVEPPAWPYRCTEPYQHAGPHRAVLGGKILAQWPREINMITIPSRLEFHRLLYAIEPRSRARIRWRIPHCAWMEMCRHSEYRNLIVIGLSAKDVHTLLGHPVDVVGDEQVEYPMLTLVNDCREPA